MFSLAEKILTEKSLYTHPDDQHILSLFKEEESRHYAFNLLVRKYQEKVYWHIRKMVIDHNDADDLTQDVFVKIWRKLDLFRENSALFTWIYRIATNECLNFLKKKKRRFMLPIHDINKELSEKIDQNSLIEGSEIERKLQKALLTLPDRQRMVFNMKYFEDLSYKEISEILEVSEGSLKASYHIAVKKIEQILGSEVF